MRRPLATLLGVTLTAALAPAAVATAATPVAAPSAVTKATAKPYANFKISVSYDKRTKRSGKIIYKIRAKNLGPYSADYFWIGGQVPKGVKPRLRWGADKGTECTWEGRWFWCWTPNVLEKGESEWLNFQVTLKSGTKGTAVAKLGIIAYDVPQGAENIDKEELQRIGIDGWTWLKTVKTKIVWPPKKRGGGWTPPPVQTWNPPTSTHEEDNKKKDT